MKQFFIFVIKQIWNFLLVFLFAKALLTPVSADELAAAGEFVDGQTAVIGAAFAVCHGSRKFQCIDLLDGEHGRLCVCTVSFSGD